MERCLLMSNSNQDGKLTGMWKWKKICWSSALCKTLQQSQHAKSYLHALLTENSIIGCTLESMVIGYSFCLDVGRKIPNLRVCIGMLWVVIGHWIAMLLSAMAAWSLPLLWIENFLPSSTVYMVSICLYANMPGLFCVPEFFDFWYSSA